MHGRAEHRRGGGGSSGRGPRCCGCCRRRPPQRGLALARSCRAPLDRRVPHRSAGASTACRASGRGALATGAAWTHPALLAIVRQHGRVMVLAAPPRRRRAFEHDQRRRVRCPLRCHRQKHDGRARDEHDGPLCATPCPVSRAGRQQRRAVTPRRIHPQTLCLLLVSWEALHKGSSCTSSHSILILGMRERGGRKEKKNERGWAAWTARTHAQRVRRGWGCAFFLAQVARAVKVHARTHRRAAPAADCGRCASPCSRRRSPARPASSCRRPPRWRCRAHGAAQGGARAAHHHGQGGERPWRAASGAGLGGGANGTGGRRVSGQCR